MQLSVEQVTKSKSGKALRVKANGAWYGARLNSGLDQAAGKTIEAEVQHDETYGDQINAWKLVGAPTNGAAKPNGSATASTGNAPVWLQMASNTVAHALNAGVLKEPSEIKSWVLAVKQAVEGE